MIGIHANGASKKSNGNYYRNGLLPSLFDNPENYLKELEAFPDNYAVYRSRWQLLILYKQRLCPNYHQSGNQTITKKGEKE
ncbi:MAG: hypothetical protein R3B93_23000 [Bacteroidia bacterium]